jgi:hypothetical protein
VLLASIFFMMHRDRVLVTGDKRFLTSLRQNIPLEFGAAADRIVSFEACLLAVTTRYGFAYVLTRVREVASCDGSLSLAIGHAGDCRMKATFSPPSNHTTRSAVDCHALLHGRPRDAGARLPIATPNVPPDTSIDGTRPVMAPYAPIFDFLNYGSGDIRAP